MSLKWLALLIVLAITISVSNAQNGNVGIGTKNPTAKLDVYSAGGNVLRLHNVPEVLNDTTRVLVIDDSGYVKQRNMLTPSLAVFLKRATTFVGSGNSLKTLTFDEEVYDPNNAFTPGADHVTITSPGLYQIFANATVDGTGFNVGDAWFLRIMRNGVAIGAIDATKAAGASAACFAIDNFAAGDQISVQFGTKPTNAIAQLTRLVVYKMN